MDTETTVNTSAADESTDASDLDCQLELRQHQQETATDPIPSPTITVELDEANMPSATPPALASHNRPARTLYRRSPSPSSYDTVIHHKVSFYFLELTVEVSNGGREWRWTIF